MVAPAAMRALRIERSGRRCARVAELDLAFEDAADVDLDVAAAAQRAAHVEARRVGEAHAVGHQPLGGAPLQPPLEFGELQPRC